MAAPAFDCCDRAALNKVCKCLFETLFSVLPGAGPGVELLELLVTERAQRQRGRASQRGRGAGEAGRMALGKRSLIHKTTLHKLLLHAGSLEPVDLDEKTRTS